MPACAPQRFLVNNRNLIRTAILAPSSVLPIEQSVIEIARARLGTAQVAIAGAYDGTEEADYDIEIVDTAVTNPLISAPIASGEGSGTLTNISSSLDPQKITVQLNDNGLPTLAAGVDFEGVKIVARNPGAAGNVINISIDQFSLAFAPTSFSLLADLKAGDGSPDNGLVGPAYDWDTKVIGGDNVIPADAHRVSFGEDTLRIYLQYKKFVAGVWNYYFVPSLQTDVPAGTLVKFVSNGRFVTVDGGVSPAEEYSGIITDYDLLNALQTQSQLVTVEGVVANDRTPTGQAARESLIRTDAHVDRSTGTGSAAATGFVDAFANYNANTELVTATCIAATFKDSPLAHVGAELWDLKGSVSGELGQIVTGVPFVAPGATPPKFGLTIPQRLPNGFGTPKGRFDVASINYVGRPDGVEDPPLCVGDQVLGASARDGSITLKWTRRPSGACQCKDMPFEPINDDCLGLGTTDDAGGEPVYGTEAQAVMAAFTDHLKTLADSLTEYRPGVGIVKYPSSNISMDPEKIAIAGNFSGPGYSGSVDGSSDAGTGVALPWWDVIDSTKTLTAFMYSYGMIPDVLVQFANEFEQAVQAFDALADGSPKTAGLAGMTACDGALFDDVSAAIAVTPTTQLYDINTPKYRLYIRSAFAAAGLPYSGKSDASTGTSDDGCWHDLDDAYYWTVVGSDGSVYAPAFINHVYYATRRATQNSPYYSTKEFAFQVNCQCPDKLLEGDEIVLAINGSGYGATYQVGDTLVLPIIAAAPLFLTGGQDGNSIQTWNVYGSLSGPLGNFTFDPDSPAPYTNGSPPNLGFTYVPGGIAAVKGDRFTFSIEGGRYRVRKNAGAWSAPILIADGAVALDDGLTLEFVTGAAPSFVANDLYSFRALQPWAASNIQSPNPARWQWASTSPDVATLVADFGSAQTVAMLGLAQHTMPVGTTLLIEGGNAPGVYTESETVLYRAGTITHLMSEPWSVRYVRLTITGAGSAGIGWLWMGDPMSTSLSADVVPSRGYLVSRSNGGLYQGGKYLARTRNYSAEWTEGALSEADMALLDDFLDWVKTHDDEPFIFVPNVTRLDLSELQRVVDDSVEYSELSDLNRDEAFEFRAACKLSMQGVWR